MRVLSVIYVISIQFGCADQTAVTQSDCRTLSGECSGDFRCTVAPSGQFECLPEMSVPSQTNPESSGNMADVPGAQLEIGESGSEASERDADAEPIAEDTQPETAAENAPVDGASMAQDDETPSTPTPTTQAPLGRVDMCQRLGVLGPVLPAEAGHRAATVLTPTQYPYLVSSIRYELLTPQDTPSCTSALAHTTELMVIAASDPLPPIPGDQMLRFRSYSVPADTSMDDGRAVALTLPRPLYLAEGEQLVVSIELAASQNRHLCLSRCLDYDADGGIDWWSNAAEPPYNWSDLIVDYNLKGALRIQAFSEEVGTN